MCKHKSNSTPHFRNVKLLPFFCICSIEKQENALISDRRLLLAVPVSNSVLMALERRAFLQGDPNQTLLIQMGITLKRYISDLTLEFLKPQRV